MKGLVKFIGIVFILALIAGVIYTLKNKHRENIDVKTIVISDQEDTLAVEKIHL